MINIFTNKNICSYFNQINSNLNTKADVDSWKSGTITESGTTDLFTLVYHRAWLLVGWLLSGQGSGSPVVCIAVEGATEKGNIATISEGTSVSFTLAEDGKTIQFVNPYGNICFWHAISL